MQNESVLQHMTIANVLLNLEEPQQIGKRAKFFSGDWSKYAAAADDCKFDYILTSETIYNPNNYGKVLDVLKQKLKANGTCYLAAKVHYFGVGGSLRDFERAINEDGAFKSECVFVYNENLRREILKIVFKNKDGGVE